MSAIRCIHALLLAGFMVVRDQLPPERVRIPAVSFLQGWSAAPATASAVRGAVTGHAALPRVPIPLVGRGALSRRSVSVAQSVPPECYMSRFHSGLWQSRPVAGAPRKRYKNYDPVDPQFVDRMRESGKRVFTEAEPTAGHPPVYLTQKESEDQPWLRDYPWHSVAPLFFGKWRHVNETAETITFSRPAQPGRLVDILYMVDDDPDYNVVDVAWLSRKGALTLRLASANPIKLRLTMAEQGFIRNEWYFESEAGRARKERIFVDYLRREDPSSAPTDLAARLPTSRWLNVGRGVSMKSNTPIFVVSPVCSVQRHRELRNPPTVSVLCLTRDTLRGFEAYIRSLGGPFAEWLRFHSPTDDTRVVAVIGEEQPLPIALILPPTASRMLPEVHCIDSAVMNTLADALRDVLQPMDVGIPSLFMQKDAPEPPFTWQTAPGERRHLTIGGASGWHDSWDTQSGITIPDDMLAEHLLRWGADEELKKRKGEAVLKRWFTLHYTPDGVDRTGPDDRTERSTTAGG